MVLFTIGALGAFLSVVNDPMHLYSILPLKCHREWTPEIWEKVTVR